MKAKFCVEIPVIMKFLQKWRVLREKLGIFIGKKFISTTKIVFEKFLS